MYSESNRRAATSRANDEFLRRMIGGELVGGIPVMNVDAPTRPSLPDYSNNKAACDGTPRGNCPIPDVCHDCPTHVHAPSLAMVYAPKQCWRGLLDPVSGLKSGSIFQELILPLEVEGKNYGKEVKNRTYK